MTDLPRTPGDPGQPSTEDKVASRERRRLLRVGLTAAPVAMTVVSRPVLGVSVRCDAPSGFVSVNASHPGPGLCAGNSPAAWVTRGPATWKPPLDGDKNFTDAANFPDTGPLYFNTLKDKTLKDVMDVNTTGSNPPFDLARLVAAAYLNSFNGYYGNPPILTTIQIKQLWKEISTNGTVNVQVGVNWTYAELGVYLQSMMPN